MKLHNLSVIFIVIAIPLILITAYYISLQADTLNMQTSYDAKLLDSTKEAIDAFEINTVQWNSGYSDVADSKRRDVMASINTFINSFANNTGVSGTSKEYIMTHMPAIAYTLYDGYYIYSPANEQVALKDDNGVGIVMTEELCKKNKDGSTTEKVIQGYTYNKNDEGKLLYQVAKEKPNAGTYNGTPFTLNQENAYTEYKHILKPFAMYSERIGDWVINYTLDNYVTIYGNIDVDVAIGEPSKQEFIYKAGYLNLINDEKGIENVKSNTVEGIKFMNRDIKAEELTETVAYYEGGVIKTKENCPYVYECEGNTKVYFDGDKPFIINSKQERTNLEENGINKYKKITIPQNKGTGGLSYVEIYQNLVDGEWYTRDTNGQFKKRDTVPSFGGVNYGEKKLDYSAINYCVESYIITSFVNSLSGLNPAGAGGACECGYNHGSNPLIISGTNDPENSESDFCTHKRGIIKNVVESNLNQAITSYSRNNADTAYKLPKLTETDWDQILTNVSIITFIQNIPIGMKYYNNYAIATSTVNKEYVDTKEIYLNATDGEYKEYYHKPYCEKLGESNLKGYRSIDYLQQSYEYKDTVTNETKTGYYYKHANAGSGTRELEQACYYCLVQPSLYEETNDKTNKETAYNTALARERYIARMAKLPAAGNPTAFAVGYSLGVSTGKIIIDTKKSDGTEVHKEGVGPRLAAKVENVGDEITIRGERETETSAGGTIEPAINAKDTNIKNPKEVSSTALSRKSKCTTEDEVKVKIEKYDNIILQGSFTKKGEARYNVGSSDLAKDKESTTNYKETTSTSLDLGVGYINVLLHYKSTYGIDNPEAKVWANIDSTDTLTIATKLTGVTGKVRLKFTAGDKTYYSEDTFNITDSEAGEAIYCRIKDTDKKWYNNEWKVTVLDVSNADIGVGGEVEYYTISDTVEIDGEIKKGMQELSEAINTGANTKKADGTSRKFYLIDDTEMKDISIDPIAKSCETGAKWFDGYFGSGIYENDEVRAAYIDETTGEGVGVKTISNIKINVSNNEKYAFGLFGWVGIPATIENLKIDAITINTNDIKGKYPVGGLAAFADAGNSINNVEVNNSTINGSSYVGGVIGYSKKQINNCIISNTTVSSIGTENVIELKGKKYNTIYVGGIAGLTEEQASINNCQVIKNSKIGEGSITIDKNISYNKDRYYVGGIVGYATNTVNSPTVEESITVKGGAIKGTGWDENKETYTGGVIGYKDTSQQINGSFSVSCTVSGHDNVGGIIGFNAGGDINDVSFNGTIQGDGENIGGIVGCNTGGNITNCANTIDISVENAKNVGGIVGCNNKKNITNCNNNALIKGKENVGGIAGITYSTTIKSCNNFGNIEAKEGFGPDYWIMWKIYTGTGGIAGKLYTSTVEQSANSGNIKSTVNVGGIAGLNWCSKVYYSYNKGNVEATSVSGQVGGICGHGSGVDILGCYNIGNIKGKKDLAGIMGSCVNDTKYPDVDLEKYEDKYLYLDFTPGEIHNYFKYCYNAGNVTDTSDSVLGIKVDSSAGILGKRMRGLNDISMSITFVECYFLDNVKQEGYKAPDIDKKDSNVHKMSEEELKRQLYIWASNDAGNGGLFINDNYMYNTITPLETNKGYEGYGVLWWELENNYSRIETYICSGYSYNGNTTNYLPIRDTFSTEIIFKNGDLKITKTLDDKLNRKEYIEHNNAKYHCWVMMIKNGTTYDIGATAKKYGTRYKSSYTVGKNDKILIVLPTGVNEVTLSPSNDASVIWDRFETYVERPQRIYYGYWGVERKDKDTGSQQVKAYYSGKIDKSKENDNHRFTLANLLRNDNSFGSIYLDGNGTGKNTEARLDTYYKDKYKATNLISTKYKYEETLTITGDTEKIKGKSGCKVSIPIQNIQTATSEQALPFYEDVSTIESAQARVRVGIYLNDSIWDKLDWAHVSTFKDKITIKAFFAGKEKTETREITYKWNYTEKNIQWFDMNIDITNIGTKEIPDKIEVTMEWDATLIGINVAIDKADVLVRYTLPSEE